MEYTKLGRTGLKVSRLCLGTMNFGPETTEPDSHAIMDRALEHGINFFDTADVYGWKVGEGITDAECMEAFHLLARTEGIFAETAGGVVIGVTAKLLSEGVLDPEAETVVINSGDGLKTPDAVAERVGPKITIPPHYEAFIDFWKDRNS